MGKTEVITEIDDSGQTIYYRGNWPEDFYVVVGNGTFQAVSHQSEWLGDYEYLCRAVKEIDNYLEPRV